YQQFSVSVCGSCAVQAIWPAYGSTIIAVLLGKRAKITRFGHAKRPADRKSRGGWAAAGGCNWVHCIHARLELSFEWCVWKRSGGTTQYGVTNYSNQHPRAEPDRV